MSFSVLHFTTLTSFFPDNVLWDIAKPLGKLLSKLTSVTAVPINQPINQINLGSAICHKQTEMHG